MSQNGTVKILVCVPAFNEAKNISEFVNKSKKYADGVLVYDAVSLNGKIYAIGGKTNQTSESATNVNEIFVPNWYYLLVNNIMTNDSIL